MAVSVSSASKGALEWEVVLDMTSAKKQAGELAKLFADIKLIDQSKVQKESDVIKEIQNEQVAQVKKTQDQITRVFKMSSQERIDASRKEAEALINSGLPAQTTGTKAKSQYKFGSPVQTTGANAELLARVKEAVSVTGDLDSITKDYIDGLTELEIQQARVSAIQKELNSLYKKGSIDEVEYLTTSQTLAAAQKDIADSISLVKERQLEYEATKDLVIGSTQEQVAAVKRLKIEYLSLSEAEKKSIKGQELKNQIIGLNTSIKAANTEISLTKEQIKSSTNAISGFFSKAFSGLRQIAYLIPGLGMAGLIGLIVDAITEGIKRIISGTQDVISKTKLLADSASKIGEKYADMSSKVRPYIDALKSANLTEQEKLAIYNKLVEIDPQIVRGIDAKTISYDNLNKNVTVYLDNLRKIARYEVNEEALKASIKQEQALEDKIKTSEKALEKLKSLYKDVGVSDVSSVSSSQFGTLNTINVGDQVLAEQRNLDKLKKSLQDQRDISAEIGTEAAKLKTKMSEAQGRSVAVIEKAIADQKALQALSTSKQEYDQIQAKIDALTKEKEAITGNAKADKKYQTEINSFIEKRRKLLEEISALERDAKQSGLIDKEKELDKINEKYDNQLQKINQLNQEYAKKNPQSRENLISDSEVQRIEAARSVETQNYGYRQDAENYIKSLDDKKAAFEALEDVKKNGTQEEVAYTRDLYKSQVGEFDNYVDYLKSQIAALSVASLAQPLNVGQLLILKDLKDKLTAATKEQNKELTEDQANAFKNMIQLANTYTDKKLAIDKKYNDAAALVEKTRGNTSEKLYKERLEGLKNQKEEELKAIADDFLKTTDAYKEFSKGFEDKSVSATKKLLEALKALREEMKKAGKDLTTIDNAIKQTSKASSSNDEYENDPKGLQRIKNIQNALSSLYGEMNFQITKTLTITGQQIQQTINQVINLLDETSSKQSKQASLVGLLYTVVNSVVNIATSLLKTKKDMASGLEPSADFAKQVTLEIEAQNSALDRQRKLVDDLYGQDRINGLLDLQDQLQKKQQETFAALKKLSIDEIVKQGEYYVDSLFHGTGDALRADTTAGKIFGILNDPLGTFVPKTVRVELKTVDTSSYKTIEDFTNLLAEIKANGGTYEGHVVVEDDIKSLQELVDNYNDLVDKQKELRSELQQIFTGTTTATIEDSIIEGFKNGKKGAEDFADNFQDLMKGALLNSLKFQTLEKPLQSFYEQFANASASDNILTREEINSLKQTYDDIVNKASEQFKNLQEFTNVSFDQGTDSNNSLTGAIKGISEQQAELLAGQFGGLRMTALDQLNVAKANLDAVQKIENHTYQLYQIRDILKYLKTNGIKVI